jgi:hypothetical protein
VVNWFIQHAMKALYPRTEALPGIEDTDVSGFLVRYRRESSTLMWLGLVAGTFAFVWSPVVTLLLPLPSFVLPRKLLDRHAFRVTYSRIYLLRQAVFLVKLAAGLCWGMHPEVRRRFAMAPYPEDPGTWREGR